MTSVDRSAGSSAPRPWHHLPVTVALEELGTGPEGLPDAEVETRRARWGTNELTFSEPTPSWRILLHQFASPLVGFLLVCAVVTAVQRHWVDTVAILTAVVLDAVIGFAPGPCAGRCAGSLSWATSSSSGPRCSPWCSTSPSRADRSARPSWAPPR